MSKKESNPGPPDESLRPDPPPAPPKAFSIPMTPAVERELSKLWVMYNPTAKAVREFIGPDADGMHDDAMLGAIHKARVIEMSQMFDESVKWLQAHDMEVPVSREQVLKLSKVAGVHLGLIKEYKH